jgi:serine/threonine-protein kinase RsbW
VPQRPLPSPPPGPPQEERARLALRHDRGEIDRAVKGILEAMERLGYSESSRFAVRLAIEEALSNAFRHGHKGLPADTAAQLEYRVAAGEVEVSVEDRGPGFDPGGVPDPTLDENLELPSGRGLMLMRAYMTRVEFNGAGNRVRMYYRRPQRG